MRGAGPGSTQPDAIGWCRQCDRGPAVRPRRSPQNLMPSERPAPEVYDGGRSESGDPGPSGLPLLGVEVYRTGLRLVDTFIGSARQRLDRPAAPSPAPV